MQNEIVPLTPEELQEAHILLNPWLFAEAFLQNPVNPMNPLFLRSYQRDILKDRHYRKILRMGRRCVAATDTIYTPHGPYTFGDLLKEHPPIWTMTKDYKLITTTNYEAWSNGVVDTVTVETASGKTQQVSIDHPFLVYYEYEPKWVEAKDLVVGDEIATVERKGTTLSDFPIWEPIKSLTPGGPANTIDLSVFDTHCFVGSDIISHNTGKTVVLAIEAVFRAFTHSHRQVLIVTAYEGQLDEIFNAIDHICFDSTKIRDSISRVTQKPHKVWFKNGSVISGNVGNNSVRGKCLPVGTQIWMADLTWKAIESIEVGDMVFSYNVEKDIAIPKPVEAVHHNGVKPIFELSTKSSRFLRATAEHRVFNIHGEYVKIGDIKTWKTHQNKADFIAAIGIDVMLSTLDGSRTQGFQLQFGRAHNLVELPPQETLDLTVADNHNFVAMHPPGKEYSGFSVSGAANGGFLVHNSADDLIIDECDYIPLNILLEAIWPIATTTKDTNVILSSTPTGRHEFFYDISRNINNPAFNFHEFHIQSNKSPEWTPEHEALIRATTDSIRYTREYCLVGNTPVLSNNGATNIKDLKIGSILYSDMVPISMTNHKFTGKKHCLHIKTDINDVKVSTDHSFNTSNGKEKASTAKEINIQPINRLAGKSDDVLWSAVIGFLYGDGTLPANGESVAFYSEDKEDLIRLKSIITRLLPNISPGNLNEKEPGFYQLRYYGYLPKYLINCGCAVGNRTLQQVNIPNFIMFGIQEVKSAFISALLSTDGNTIGADAHDRSLVLSFTKSKVKDGKHYYAQLKKLINMIGFESCITSHIQPNNKIAHSVYIRGKGSWIDFSTKFYKLIGYNLCARKDKHALALYLYSQKYNRILNYKRTRFLEIAKLKLSHSYSKLTKLYNISKKIAEKASNKIIPSRLYGRNEIESYQDFISRSLNKRGVYASIISKKDIGLKDTYNITVTSNDHSYVLANGMLTYNCAEFGEASEGVFRNKYIEPSLFIYDYNSLQNNSDNYLTMGVDWNEAAAGVRIMILEHIRVPTILQPYNSGDYEKMEPVTRHNFLRCRDHYSISAEDYTNTTAVDFILKLFKRYDINYACFDKGHGHTNWELLRLAMQRGVSSTGYRCGKMTGMLDKMRVVDSGSTSEVIDVTTNQTSKVRTKNLIVRDAVKLLENGRYVIPAVNKAGNTVELESNRLVGQMRDYSVIRTTDKGEVFSAGNDHTLDAWILATHAFLLNHDKFITWTYSTEAAVVESAGLTPYSISKRNLTPKLKTSEPTISKQGEITIRDFGLYPKQGEPPEEDEIAYPTGLNARRSSTHITSHTPRKTDI